MPQAYTVRFYPPMSATLAQLIRARRIVRGMERQDLATAVGCDVRTVRRWESGSRPLTRHVPALREALDIPIEEMDRIMLELVRNREGGLRIEGVEFLEERGLSHAWLAETLLAMDRRLIGAGTALGAPNPEHWAPIFTALPDTWRLLTHEGRIVGNWHFLPLAPSVFEQVRASRLRDDELRLEHLTTLDFPATLELYLAALILEPRYRRGTGFVMMLRSLGARLGALAEHGIHFSRIGALACTPEAILLCRRMRMNRISCGTNGTPQFFEARLTSLHDPLQLPEYKRMAQHCDS